MCIHTLRFYHDLCPHQSPVPATGPSYIPPRKCAAILSALYFYHTQPARLPEMYPPRCPRICEPVWGTAACRGNVVCQLRPGKCDNCLRTDELGGFARYLCDRIQMSCPRQPETDVDRYLAIMTLFKPRDRAEMRLEGDMLTEMGRCMERSPGLFTEEVLHETIMRVMIEGESSLPRRESVWFWMFYRDLFVDSLRPHEAAALDAFLNEPTEGTRGAMPTFMPRYGNESAGCCVASSEATLNSTGIKESRKSSCTDCKGSEHHRGEFPDLELDITKVYPATPKVQQKQSHPNPASRTFVLKHLSAQANSTTDTHQDNPHPTIDASASQPLNLHALDMPTSVSQSSTHSKPRKQIQLAPSSRTQARATRRQRPCSSGHTPLVSSPISPLREQNATSNDKLGGCCYEAHHIGDINPVPRPHGRLAWMNGRDGPSYEAAMERAMELAYNVHGRLASGVDTREDLCGAGVGTYMGCE